MIGVATFVCRHDARAVHAPCMWHNSIRFVLAGGTWPAAAPPAGVWQGGGFKAVYRHQYQRPAPSLFL